MPLNITKKIEALEPPKGKVVAIHWIRRKVEIDGEKVMQEYIYRVTCDGERHSFTKYIDGQKPIIKIGGCTCG